MIKTLATILFPLLFWTMSDRAQTLYPADTYELKMSRPCGFFADGKIFSADAYGLKDKVVGFIEAGKIYSADAYQLKNKIIGFIEGKTIFRADAYELKDKPAAFLTDGKVYAADDYGLKGKIIGYYDGDVKAGAACVTIVRLLRQR